MLCSLAIFLTAGVAKLFVVSDANTADDFNVSVLTSL